MLPLVRYKNLSLVWDGTPTKLTQGALLIWTPLLLGLMKIARYCLTVILFFITTREVQRAVCSILETI